MLDRQVQQRDWLMLLCILTSISTSMYAALREVGFDGNKRAACLRNRRRCRVAEIALAYRLTARFQSKRRYEYCMNGRQLPTGQAVTFWGQSRIRPVALRHPAVCPNLMR